MTKIQNFKRLVLVIGYWNLDIVCYLFFGAWDFPNSWIQPCLDIPHNFY